MGLKTSYYPIGLQLENQRVIVFGGGKVAERKILRLLAFKAKITVVSPDLTEKLRLSFEAKDFEWRKQRATPDDLMRIAGAALVFAVTNEPEANEAIVRAARERGVPVNRADDAQECDFILPSLLSKGGVRIAVFTEGQAPGFGKWVRRRLEASIGNELQEFAEFFACVREEVKSLSIPQEQRAKVLNSILESDVSDVLKSRGPEEALTRAREIIAAQQKKNS